MLYNVWPSPPHISYQTKLLKKNETKTFIKTNLIINKKSFKENHLRDQKESCNSSIYSKNYKYNHLIRE